ncbi:MAG: type II secretion system major pseudopilin GspG [Pseudomonadales bacterium]|nr:type II secretion system major pseudopilin GspG [Pseudomonadales bacterium]
MNKRRSPRNESGMTLIEIMMVVAILGILIAVIVPNLIGRDQDARLTAQKSDIRSIGQSLDIYHMQNGHYPSTDQGLEALVNKPTGHPEPKSWGPMPYLRKYPLDQWGNEYVYLEDGHTFELMSLGADGMEGGEGYDADVRYADL